MPSYSKPLKHYKRKLAETAESLEDIKLSLQDYLFSNTGIKSTTESNKSIMILVKSIENNGYNIKHYEAIISNIEKGYVSEGVL